MADPTTIPPNMRVVGLVTGGLADANWNGVEKASSTIRGADFLQDDGSGRLDTIAGPLDGSAVTKRALGISEASGTGVAGTPIRFVPLTPLTVVEFTLCHSASTHTLAQADVWQVFVPLKASAGSRAWYLDDTAAVKGFLVIALRDPIGTVDGRVWAVPTSTILGPAFAASDTIGF